MLNEKNNAAPSVFLWPIFNLGFRPFFLFAAIFSCIAMGWWVYIWQVPTDWQPYGGRIWWHSHEMIFGFSTAVVVGFLLTAVQNWTGIASIKGLPLLALLSLWLLGRVSMALGGFLPNMLIVSFDLLFLPAAAAVMAYPVIKAKMWRNFIFVPILLSLFILNMLSHWKISEPSSLRMMHAAIVLITLVAAIIGGRVLPMFTANGTSTKKIPPIKWLEFCSLISLLLVVIVTFLDGTILPIELISTVYLLATVFNTLRFMRMGFWHCWRTPLLWSLHAAFAFIPIGLFFLTLTSLGLLNNTSAAIHCFSVGVIGGMILSMMSRVSLGHTGRPLIAPKIMSITFLLMQIAVLLRVIIPAWLPSYYSIAITASGIAWVVAYGIFIICYCPILLRARIDGRPG